MISKSTYFSKNLKGGAPSFARTPDQWRDMLELPDKERSQGRKRSAAGVEIFRVSEANAHGKYYPFILDKCTYTYQELDLVLSPTHFQGTTPLL